jgi:hypothetical protein
MYETNSIPPVPDQAALALDEILGSGRAFSAAAGRCSAADAECLRRLRDEKLFARRGIAWEGFCPKYLGLSGRDANRIIRNLKEFGPAYFDLAQLMRMTPLRYRKIAPAVRDRSIHAHGEAIPLVPGNAKEVLAAVAEVRRALSAPPRLERDRLTAVNRRCDQILKDLRLLIAAKPRGADKVMLRSSIQETIVVLRALDLDLGQ